MKETQLFSGSSPDLVLEQSKKDLPAKRHSKQCVSNSSGFTSKPSDVQSFLREIWSSAALVYPKATWRQCYHRLKYTVRSLALFQSSKPWLTMLAEPKFQTVLAHNPRFYLKIQRPLLINGLTAKQKLQLLQSHYSFLFQKIAPAMLEQVYSPMGFCLCEWTPKDNCTYRLSLRASLQEKEGELSLVLEDVLRKSIIKYLTFSVTSYNSDGTRIVVGGLQGSRSEFSKQLVVETTRALFGLRPKSLLLFALQQLADSWLVKEILAVGNLQHVCAQRLKEIGSNSDFDKFWLEAGGVPTPSGMFLMPRTHEEKDLSEVTSSKRSIYRKRYSMLRLAAEKISRRIGDLSGE